MSESLDDIAARDSRLTEAFVTQNHRPPQRGDRITAEGGTWEYMGALGWMLVESGIEDAP